MREQTLFRTTSHITALLFPLIGLPLFGGGAYLFLSHMANEPASTVPVEPPPPDHFIPSLIAMGIGGILILAYVLFLLMMLSMFFLFEFYTLKSSKLVIIRPLMFKKTVIPLNDIAAIDTDYKYVHHDYEHEDYWGKAYDTKVELRSGQRIVLTSNSINDYGGLVDALSEQWQKARLQTPKESA